MRSIALQGSAADVKADLDYTSNLQNG